MGKTSGARDLVHFHVTENLPIQAHALPFANRVEIRLGRAFPVALVVDAAALDRLTDALTTVRDELKAATGKCDTGSKGGST